MLKNAIEMYMQGALLSSTYGAEKEDMRWNKEIIKKTGLIIDRAHITALNIKNKELQDFISNIIMTENYEQKTAKDIIAHSEIAESFCIPFSLIINTLNVFAMLEDSDYVRINIRKKKDRDVPLIEIVGKDVDVLIACGKQNACGDQDENTQS